MCWYLLIYLAHLLTLVFSSPILTFCLLFLADIYLPHFYYILMLIFIVIYFYVGHSIISLIVAIISTCSEFSAILAANSRYSSHFCYIFVSFYLFIHSFIFHYYLFIFPQFPCLFWILFLLSIYLFIANICCCCLRFYFSWFFCVINIELLAAANCCWFNDDNLFCLLFVFIIYIYIFVFVVH